MRNVSLPLRIFAPPRNRILRVIERIGARTISLTVLAMLSVIWVLVVFGVLA